MFFVTHGSEVKTESMIEQAWLDKKIVVVPKSNVSTCKISAYKIESLRKDLQKGNYGIREPKPGTCQKMNARKIDLVFVPGLSFDLSGHRIGYGKGYYDSWLKYFPVKARVGLSYDFQVLKKIPKSGKDLPVGKIVTDKRIIKTQ